MRTSGDSPGKSPNTPLDCGFCCWIDVFWCRIEVRCCTLPASSPRHLENSFFHMSQPALLAHGFLQDCLSHREMAVYESSLPSFASWFSKARFSDPHEEVSPSPIGLAVSPGFRPRPSLSAPGVPEGAALIICVSPGFRPRPSLSVPVDAGVGAAVDGVAGVSAPAFVERAS